jgi:hypothetical protein
MTYRRPLDPAANRDSNLLYRWLARKIRARTMIQ